MTHNPSRSQSLGDIADIRAYVAAIVASLSEPLRSEEFDDFVSEGVTLALERASRLAPGESLRAALAGSLRHDLQDYWRTQHPEWRRNSRAGFSYHIETATGLAHEHEEDTLRSPGPGPERLAQSLANLASITNPSQLRDPHVIGAFASGAPSYAALPAGLAQKVCEAITEERHTYHRPAAVVDQPFRILLDPDVIL